MSPASPQIPCITAHGACIPQVGLGTMTLTGRSGLRAIETALEVGYRHIDTAAYYENEHLVGAALRNSGVRREDVFITTKVRAADAKPDDFARVVDQSLANLQLPYVDLLLIHWPSKDVPLHLTVAALCKAKREGKARHVGVSNFTTALLEEAWMSTSEPLVCNQIECHPYINQDKVVAACEMYGMAVVAYVPMGRGGMAGEEVLARIGAAHGRTAAQIAMRYLIQRGMAAVPRSSDRQHLIDNLNVFDFALTRADMAELDALKASHTRLVDPPSAPVWDTP